MRMLSFFVLLFLACGSVKADIFDPAKYQDVTLPNLTNFVVRAKLTTIKNANNMLDYLLVSDCDIYNSIKDSPFKQQEVLQSLTTKIATIKAMEVKPLYIHISSSLLVNGYNFDTQSFTISQGSQLSRVNVMELVKPIGNEAFCGVTADAIRTIPTRYQIKLSSPVSLYRIPLRKDFAEELMAHMDKAQQKGSYILYETFYLRIEPSELTLTPTTALLHGELNEIDIYSDRNHKVLIKRLNYGESY